MPMLAFMWIATLFNLVGFLFQFGTCCRVCCCSGKENATKKGQPSNNGGAMAEKQRTGAARDVVVRRLRWKNRRIEA